MSENDLEYKLLFAILVAGKTARFAQGAMSQLHQALDARGCWTGRWISSLGEAVSDGCLSEVVRDARVGNYRRTERAFQQLAQWTADLATCTVDDLEAIHGVGRKTSRFFLRWTGRRERYAVLDVHILRWLRERGHDVGDATPQSACEYARVEAIYLHEADSLGVHPADLDEQIWCERNASGIRA